jgi:dTDP-3-amino-3,6-dideoxy-alpha-D-glucopyranose N,N-dimethyltransferase
MTYEQSADLYDLFLPNKDYDAEASRLLQIVHESFGSFKLHSVLDVACGSGRHLRAFSASAQILAGVDLSDRLLSIARSNVPDALLVHADLRSFRLVDRYDLVTCLFSSIVYAASDVDELKRALAHMFDHVAERGVLVVEPGFTPQQWVPGRLAFRTVRDDGVNAVRMSTAGREGNFAVFDEHYLVGTPNGTDHRVESHRFRLFEADEYREAFDSHAGDVVYHPEGLIGRGLYLCGKH